MHMATHAYGNTCIWQHMRMATHAYGNTCNAVYATHAMQPMHLWCCFIQATIINALHIFST